MAHHSWVWISAHVQWASSDKNTHMNTISGSNACSVCHTPLPSHKHSVCHTTLPSHKRSICHTTLASHKCSVCHTTLPSHKPSICHTTLASHKRSVCHTTLPCRKLRFMYKLCQEGSHQMMWEPVSTWVVSEDFGSASSLVVSILT